MRLATTPAWAMTLVIPPAMFAMTARAKPALALVVSWTTPYPCLDGPPAAMKTSRGLITAACNFLFFQGHV